MAEEEASEAVLSEADASEEVLSSKVGVSLEEVSPEAATRRKQPASLEAADSPEAGVWTVGHHGAGSTRPSMVPV